MNVDTVHDTNSEPDMEWAVENILARATRPGYPNEVSPEVVSAWLDCAEQMGVEAIICLLSDSELTEYYAAKGIDLLQSYRNRGFQVVHVPARDHQQPALRQVHIDKLRQAFLNAPRPILIHCSAGMDRTGMAIRLFDDEFS